MGGLSVLGLLVVATTVEFQERMEITLDASGTGKWYSGTLDTFTRRDEPDSSHSEGALWNARSRLHIEDENTGEPHRHVFVRMPILGEFVPPGSTVSAATLYLYLYRENANLTNTYAQDNLDTDISNDAPDPNDNYKIDQVDSPWDEALTWNQELAMGLTNIGYQTMHDSAALHYSEETADDFYDTATETYSENDLVRNTPYPVPFDVTAAVQQWVQSSVVNHGVRLMLRDDDASKAQLSFRSVEHALDGPLLPTRAPKLEIIFVSSGAPPPVTDSVDCYTGNGSPTNAYGTTNDGRLVMEDWGTGRNDTYVRFNLASVSVPAGKVVNDAYVSLAAYREHSNPPARAEVDLVLDTWDESTLTWNDALNVPVYKLHAGRTPHSFGDTTERYDTPSWLYFDVTQAARLWLELGSVTTQEPVANFGVCLRGDSQNPDSQLDIQFHSSENTYGSQHNPRLLLTYKDEPGTPPIAKIASPDPTVFSPSAPLKVLPGSRTLDGSASQGTGLLHHWTVVDPGGAPHGAVGETASFDFSISGTYTIYLRVAEPDGETDVTEDGEASQDQASTAVRVVSAAEWPPEPTAVTKIDLRGTVADNSDPGAVLFIRAEIAGTEVCSSYVGLSGVPGEWSLDDVAIPIATGTPGTIDVKVTDVSGNPATLQVVVEMKELVF